MTKNKMYDKIEDTESLLIAARAKKQAIEKLTFLDMKLFEDNIYNLLNIAEEYILKNIRWRSEITGTEREEIP